MITVVVAEDQVLVKDALTALLRTERDLDVIGNAADGGEALRLAIAVRPDVLLADIEMPTLTGIELAAEVRRANLPTRVVILTTFARPGYLTRALDAGALGYLLKDSRPEALADAIRRVARGLRAVDPKLAADASTLVDVLTDRERQLLRLTAEGRNGSEIAASLDISEGTVRNHLSQAMAKLSASSRTDAARIARDNGWL